MKIVRNDCEYDAVIKIIKNCDFSNASISQKKQLWGILDKLLPEKTGLYKAVNILRRNSNMTIVELSKSLSQHVKEKAMECKTVDELMTLAKENSVDLTAEMAGEILKATAGGDLSDEDLDAVAGGKNSCSTQDMTCGTQNLINV